MTDTISKVVLQNLKQDIVYARKVIPYLNTEYFSTDEEKVYFTCITNFFNKYNTLPTKEALDIQFEQLKISQKLFDKLKDMNEEYDTSYSKPTSYQWLVDETESFCKERKLHLAIAKSLEIVDGEEKNLSKTAIPQILAEALAVSFDDDLGHDYIEDAIKRYEYYNNVEIKIPLFLDSLNFVTNGGIPRKTLNAVISETGGGKSIFLCNLAANYVLNGETVLYLTLEMAEEEIAKRIDANLMDKSISSVDEQSDTDFINNINHLKTKLNMTKNKLIIRQYPTSSAHVGHFKSLLKELELKRGFKPTVIIIDYLNICASAKIKANNNMYLYVKSISEEFRAMAIEQDVVLWTALQFNTEGTANSDPEITDVAESRGLNHTLDFLIALITTEDLAAMGQVMIKQMKSRYGDKDKFKRFSIALDKDKMRFRDIPNTNLSQQIQQFKNKKAQAKNNNQTKTVQNIVV